MECLLINFKDFLFFNYYFYDAKQRETESGVVEALKPLTYEIAMNQQKFERWVRTGQRSDL